MAEHCKNGHERTLENTRYIRDYKTCKVCDELRSEQRVQARVALSKNAQFTDDLGGHSIAGTYYRRGANGASRNRVFWKLPNEVLNRPKPPIPFYVDGYLLEEETDNGSIKPGRKRPLVSEWDSEPEWMAHVIEIDQFPIFSIEAINNAERRKREKQQALELQRQQREKWRAQVQCYLPAPAELGDVLDVLGYPYRYRRGLLKDIGDYQAIARAAKSTETEVLSLLGQRSHDDKLALRLWQLIFREDRLGPHSQVTLWTSVMRQRLRTEMQKRQLRYWDVAYKLGVLPCLIKALLSSQHQVLLPVRVYKELAYYYQVDKAVS